VVYGIVKSHGGEITVYSEPGKGSTFHVFFKMEAQEKLRQDRIYPTEEIPGGTESILFIDDEQDLVDVAVQVLKKLGYQVKSAASSMEALEIFRSDPYQYDVVISDQTMPKITGLHLAGKIKRIRPDMPVILCSGFSENIDEEICKAQGIDAFLMKPIARKDIARVVRGVLDKKK
jgi:CheY-like chemotaxis protein